MGAKVGNMGGSTVELFSWESTEAVVNNHTFTNEEKTKLLAYCDEYDFFEIVVYAYGYETHNFHISSMNDMRIMCKPLKEGLTEQYDTEGYQAGDYFSWFYPSSGASVGRIRFNNEGLTLELGLSGTSAQKPTYTKSYLKIYGVKL
jgi:hypothetical protein